MAKFADTLRNEVKNENERILEEIILPKKDQILSAVAAGIKRIGYVVIDTSGYDTSSYEGRMTGIYKQEYLGALYDFLEGEGFRVVRSWWGLSTNVSPDMLKITL